MYYESMPLYPALRPGCDRQGCVRVPLFEAERGPGRPEGDVLPCRRVTIENPCRSGEFAEVSLGLDSCGNLVVCVHRDARPECDMNPCRPPRPRPRCLPEPRRCADPCFPPPPPRGCDRGRLYGTWR